MTEWWSTFLASGRAPTGMAVPLRAGRADIVASSRWRTVVHLQLPQGPALERAKTPPVSGDIEDGLAFCLGTPVTVLVSELRP